MMRNLQVNYKCETRSGLTLIEVTVALSVIALLLVLVVPAIVAARESQRRVVCSSRIANLGRAIASHEATRGYFPSAVRSDNLTLKRSSKHIAPHVQMLPYLDQSSLYSQLHLDVSGIVLSWSNHFGPQLNDPNGVLERVRLADFVCPSDSSWSGTLPGNNYRTNIGPWYFLNTKRTVDDGAGAFVGLEDLRPADFRDGLSHTIGMSERLHGSGDQKSFDRQRDYWFTGYELLNLPVPKLDDMIVICNAVTPPTPPPEFSPFPGAFWFFSGCQNTWYNHAYTPNSPLLDCSNTTQQSFLPSGQEISTARSLHTGGVNCVYMDGHVAFISNSIDLGVWRAASTRSGGELVNSD
jgi:prepilin-type N-terminal cleavage/methylation domain-containing protein/prepilin-type processing-associated H-X9-DG protein